MRIFFSSVLSSPVILQSDIISRPPIFPEGFLPIAWKQEATGGEETG